MFIGDGRSIWKQSPDTEEVRQHLLNIVSGVESRDDEGYHFYSAPAHIHALDQLVKWGEQRVIGALKAPSQYLDSEKREEFDEIITEIQRRINEIRPPSQEPD